MGGWEAEFAICKALRKTVFAFWPYSVGGSKAAEAASSAYYNPANPHNVYMPMVSNWLSCLSGLESKGVRGANALAVQLLQLNPGQLVILLQQMLKSQCIAHAVPHHTKSSILLLGVSKQAVCPSSLAVGSA